MINIAINGFGRIGKNFLRTLLQDKDALKYIKVMVINIGKSDPESCAFYFKYDTLMSNFPDNILYRDDNLIINDISIKIAANLDPEKIDWQKYNIDWVVDCTGKFTKREQALRHIKSGAKKVLISAPGENSDVTIIPGVNMGLFNKDKDQIISLGSCTTNALAPMIKILDDEFKVENAFMTTVHAYTNSQALLDTTTEIKDMRKKRAAALNIIPTTTGATKVIDYIFPHLKGKIKGNALRVPVAKVSLIDLNVVVKSNNLDVKTVNDNFKRQASLPMKNILDFTDLPLVSSDYYGNNNSVIIDGLLTQVNSNTIKIFGWYDNEWGYANRLKDFLIYYAK